MRKGSYDSQTTGSRRTLFKDDRLHDCRDDGIYLWSGTGRLFVLAFVVYMRVCSLGLVFRHPVLSLLSVQTAKLLSSSLATKIYLFDPSSFCGLVQC